MTDTYRTAGEAAVEAIEQIIAGMEHRPMGWDFRQDESRARSGYSAKCSCGETTLFGYPTPENALKALVFYHLRPEAAGWEAL